MSNPLTPERVKELQAETLAYDADCPIYANAAQITYGEFRALLTFHAERSGVCRWTADEDSDSWDASCGRKWSFLTDGPTENGVTFCHGCGRQVEVVR